MMEPDGSFKDKISFELEKNATAERECRHVGMLSERRPTGRWRMR